MPRLAFLVTATGFGLAVLGYLLGIAEISPGFLGALLAILLVYPYFKARQDCREAVFVSSTVNPDDPPLYQLLVDSCAWLMLLIMNVGALVHSLWGQ